jgi:hypothetical protein
MSLSRRELLTTSAAAGIAAAVLHSGTTGMPAQEMQLKGNIKHSVVFWCFNIAGDKWSIDQTCEHAKNLGLQIGGDLRTGRVANVEEARLGLRHCGKRNAGRAVHEGLEQSAVSRAK